MKWQDFVLLYLQLERLDRLTGRVSANEVLSADDRVELEQINEALRPFRPEKPAGG